MSIIDKAKAVVNGNAELTAAIEEQTATRQRIAQFQERGQKLSQELAQAKASLGELALDESAAGRKRYDAALAKVEQLERDLRHNSDAHAAVNAKLQDIARRITELGLARTIRTFERVAAERLKKAERLQAACAAYAEAYRDYIEANQKLLVAFPAVQFDCEARAVARATAVELYRAWPVSLLDKLAPDRLTPGAHNGLGLDAPSNIAPLADTVKEANAAMLRRLKDNPAQASQPTLAEIFDAGSVAPQEQGGPSATVSADEIMAALERKGPVHVEIAPVKGAKP